MAPVLHTILVLVVAYVTIRHGYNEYTFFLWVVPAIVSFPSSVIALLFANIPTVIDISASPTVLQVVPPTASFVIVGGLQWFLIGQWIDSAIAERHPRQPTPCTKRIAGMWLLCSLSLGALPFLLYRFIDSLFVYGMGCEAMVFIFPTLLTWVFAGFLLLVALYGLIRFPSSQPAGHCVCCGYDLRGSSQRCPECGTAFVRSEPE